MPRSPLELDEDDDILRPLSDDELLILLNLYKNNKTYSINAYCFILNHIEWMKKIDNLKNVKSSKVQISDKCLNQFYTHKNADLKNGTFVSITKKKDYSISFYTLQKDLSELRECINKTNRIQYNAGPLFSDLHTDHISVLYDYLKVKNITIEWIINTGYYSINKILAAQYDYEIPEDVEIFPLTISDSEIINNHWPHNYPESYGFILNMIEFNGGLGIYSKKDGKLLSWIIKNEFYGLGLLQTIESEKRKGYGTILLKALSKKISIEDNEDIITFIVDENEISKKIFFSMGFKREGSVRWLLIKRS